ncbi:MAG TPA: AAA family ATPase [Isosphaeraceae bacterium]|jgi:hypothetical protein|nr:AAA family ATPase [Isosphaeraceae bacterium]
MTASAGRNGVAHPPAVGLPDAEAARLVAGAIRGAASSEAPRLLSGSPEWLDLYRYVEGAGDDLRGRAERADRHLKGLSTRAQSRDCAEAMARALADARVAPDDGPAPMPTATLADVRTSLSATRWLWERWIAEAQLTALAAPPGTGKTRLAFDLARRFWLGHELPGGATNPLPPGTKTLWVPADRNYAELLAAAEPFGLPPEAILLNAAPDDPFGGLDLDDPANVAGLAARAADHKPALIIIDTIGMCTRRNLTRPEEAFEFFGPLLEMALAQKVAILALTHMNLGGEALGRRIIEKARSVIYMSQPDPEIQPNRRRLWVAKSNVIKPAALGVTMGDDGNDYDDKPPTEPQPERRAAGRPAIKSVEQAEWLIDQLKGGPVAVGCLIEVARTDGHLKSPSAKDPKPSISPLYAARDRIPKIRPGTTVHEFVAPGGQGDKDVKHWELVEAGDDDAAAFGDFE